MTAATTETLTPRREGVELSVPAAASKILAGTIVVVNSSGYAAAGSTATGVAAVGMAQQTVDNADGSAGDKQVPVRRGTFAFANSASSDEITWADYGADCYIVDNQTVAKTDGTSTRSVAGTVRGLDDAGRVWVEF